MRSWVRFNKLFVVIVVLAMLLSLATAAYAADKTAKVNLYPYTSPVGTAGVVPTGTITVFSSTGPTGGTVLSVSVDNTVAGETYVLYLGRDGRDFRIISIVTQITGTGGLVTIDGIQLDKAPTNGQSFQLVDVYPTYQIVAVSDPIKY